MFVPKTKHTRPKRSTGLQFFLKNGKRYVGLFVQLFDGRFFTGSTVTSLSQELFETKELNNEEEAVSLDDLKTRISISPTQRDKDAGFYQRYFLKDIRTKKIVEVTLVEYNSAREQNSRQRVTFPWQIKGPNNDVYLNGYVYMGVSTNNRVTVERVNQIMTGLVDTINGDYTKYNENVVIKEAPASTRPDSTQSFYIPSPSKKL